MTDYLTVPNWKEHQHRDLAGKGDMPWFKLKSGIFDDPKICELTPHQFRAYIRALTLAARTGNKLPARANWLRAHFGTSWRQLCECLLATDLLQGELPLSTERVQSEHRASARQPLDSRSRSGHSSESKESLQNDGPHRATDAPTPSLEERRVDKTKAVLTALPGGGQDTNSLGNTFENILKEIV